MARTHSPEPNRYGFGTLRQGGMDGKKEERKGRVVSFEEDRSYKCVNGGDSVWGKYENDDDDDKDSIRSKAKIENFLEFPRFGAKVNDGFLSSKSEKIKERLQQSIRDEVKEKIANILHEVEQLSDVEKLLLYLQLPTGIPADDVLKQKSHNNPLGKKADMEVFQTCTWIQTHLMEDPNVSLPKQEVYEEYKSFCSSNNLEPLCAADFGKVMKQVFPSVKPRRLGTRGNSRYCYSGLTKNLTVKLPVLPNICSKKEGSDVETKDSSDDDMHTAACQLVLEWAEKLLEEKFTALTDLAWYLVESLCVDSRSVAAFTLLFLSNADGPRKGNQAANFLKQVCGNRKRETQIHLQRKLQEKELIKEQKKKVQEQRQIAKSVLNKTSASRKCQRTVGKKASLASQSHASEKLASCTKELCASPMLEDKNSQSKRNDNDNSVETDDGGKLLHSFQTSDKLITQQVEITNGIEQGCDEKQKLEKVPIPRKSTRTSAVCISPGMPNIIAVSPVQITLLGPQTSPKSNNKYEKKYKRIQPKSNASKLASKSSAVLPLHSRKSHKKQANETSMQKGRKSSNLWNHTEEISSERSSEESNGTKVAPQVAKANSCAASNVTEKPTFEVDSIEGVYPVICSNNGRSTLNLNGNLNFDNSDELCATSEIKNADMSIKDISNTDFPLDRDDLYNNFIPSGASNVEDVIPATVKRHCEDPNPDATASKKPLLENIFKNAISCLPNWEIKDNVTKLEQTDKLLAETLMQAVGVAEKQAISNCEQEEVSIYKLETDALIEYFQDLSAESNPVLNEKLDENLCDKTVQQQAVQHTNNQKLQSTSTAAQLSQLRMLLERNLPKPTNKNASIRNLKSQSNHLETQDLPATSSVIALNSDCFDLKNQQENENKLTELSQIVLRETGNVVSKVPSNSYDEKLTDVYWSDTRDESATVQKNNGLEESNLVENMSDDQVLSHIQNSILSGENSGDIDIRNGISQQPIDITSNNSINNLPSFSDTDVHQLQNLCETKCISTYTQIPSVPPSPNARRRAFNFLPISPRQTPILESVPSGNTVIASPVPSQLTAASSIHSNTVSVAVGSSRPTSAASSPFVSPRSTPVPLSRSRHNSGQSLYSTSRQTPLQNFDSGVSSISTSPFISPQPTPLPVSRLRHNSSHSQSRTVTFNATSSPHTMYSQSIFTGSRSRHNSGPGIPHQLGQTMSPRSAPLSPMVSECHTQSHFSFPCVGDTPTLRSRHNSASSVTPLSPVSEQVSPPSNNNEVQINNDQLVSCETSLTSQYSLNVNKSQELELPVGSFESGCGDMQYQQLKSLLNSKIMLPHSPSSKHQQPAKLATVQSDLKQQWLSNRQRHASGPLLFQRSNQVSDQSSQEIQVLLRNASYADPYASSNRSQSVPPYQNQMLQNLISQCSSVVHEDSIVSKSHPTTPVISNSFTFSPSKMVSGSSTVMETAATFVSPPLASDAMFSTHITDPDEILVNGSQSQAWESLNREINGVPISARRNITDILGQPREDLEVTLDDLRDFDTDFSKLAQELEDMNRNDENDLS